LEGLTQGYWFAFPSNANPAAFPDGIVFSVPALWIAPTPRGYLPKREFAAADIFIGDGELRVLNHKAPEGHWRFYAKYSVCFAIY
jgi:hypothetical protein